MLNSLTATKQVQPRTPVAFLTGTGLYAIGSVSRRSCLSIPLKPALLMHLSTATRHAFTSTVDVLLLRKPSVTRFQAK